MKKIVVAGSGVLGAQIAFQCAFKGLDVTVLDVDRAGLDALPDRLAGLADAYHRDLQASKDDTDAARSRLAGTTDMVAAVQGAALVIEAIPEDLELKRTFYAALSEAAPDAILATNSSTLRPSAIASAVLKPERFLALHFANRIWLHNTAEIMGHPGTDPAVFDQVVAFAEQIGMVPLPLHKEQPGYIINSLLVPYLEAAIALAMNGVADPETIDRTWMLATGAPRGPFATLDVIGMRTSYALALRKAASGDPASAAAAEWIKRAFIDANRLGVETGQGFYTYPRPRYQDPDFLTGKTLAA